MQKRRRTFSRAFKLKILREAEIKPMAEVCREHNVDITMVSRWKAEFGEEPNSAFTKKPGRPAKDEKSLANYERLVGQLYAENAFLKKTLETLQERQAEQKKRKFFR